MGFSFWDLGGCNCPGVTATVQMHGCQSQPYPGLTASITTNPGGVLVASGTTDATGFAGPFSISPSTDYTLTITGQSSRFGAYSYNFTSPSSGNASLGTTLTPANGYACLPGSTCLLPVAKTWNCTINNLGQLDICTPSNVTGTMTYSTGVWSGNFTNDCGTFTFQYPYVQGSNVYLYQAGCEVAVSITCPTSFAMTATPPPNSCSFASFSATE